MDAVRSRSGIASPLQLKLRELTHKVSKRFYRRGHKKFSDSNRSLGHATGDIEAFPPINWEVDADFGDN